MLMKSNRPVEQLDTPSTAGNVTIRVNRNLLCPNCDHALRSFHAHPQDTDSAVVLDCPGCHTRIFTLEVDDADLN